jgi:hypothetical protein
MMGHYKKADFIIGSKMDPNSSYLEGMPRKKPTEFDEYNKFSTYLPNMRNLGPF